MDTPSFSPGTEDALQTHILQMVGGQGLFTPEQFTNRRNAQFRMLLQQMDDT